MNLRACGLTLAVGCLWNSVALAADLAPPPDVEPAPSLPLHGFFDLNFKNDYITPRGLLVHNQGADLQLIDALALDVYTNPTGFITNIAVTGGTFQDFNLGFQPPNTNTFNEIDYFGGAQIKFGQGWEFDPQYVQFDSPQSAFHVERNLELKLSYDDSAFWNKAFSINPYGKFFYTFHGQSSTVIVGQTGTFDVELGAVPKVALPAPFTPVSLTFPTWFTVGPSNFWGGSSNFGVFATGLIGILPLDSIPYGHWWVHAGIQFYYELNDRLLLSQTFVETATHRDVFVPSMGISVAF